MGRPAADLTLGGPGPKDGAASSAADGAVDAAAADAAADPPPAPPRPLDGGEAGRLLELGFEEAAEIVDRDLLEGVRAALGHRLHRACEPGEGLVDYYRKVLEGGGAGRKSAVRDWRSVMNRRIQHSWMVKDPDLVWLDDKYEQVGRAAALLGGREVHLPILAHAAAGDEAALAALKAAVRERVARNEPIVVKPRHGSNSKHVSLWPVPLEVGEAEVLASTDSAMESWDDSWDKESWNQNAVPRGCLLQPLYAPMSSFLDPGEEVGSLLSRPLELKVQVLFGEAVGGCLNTHCSNLWVTRRGGVRVWDQTRPGFLRRHQTVGFPLPPQVLEVLRRALRESWGRVRADSEALARAAGLDELRVDWLLGDPRWGPRVGELTYMGAFALAVVPISTRLARAFAAAHLERLAER